MSAEGRPQTPTVEIDNEADDRSLVWRSRLALIAMALLVVGMAAVAFFTDASELDIKDPPNQNLVALAEDVGGRFEYWDENSGDIAFTIDMLADTRSVEDIEAEVRRLAVVHGLESLRDLDVVRIAGRYKISGYVATDD